MDINDKTEDEIDFLADVNDNAEDEIDFLTDVSDNAEDEIDFSTLTPTPTKQNNKPMQLRLPPDFVDRIDRAAKRRGVTRTSFIAYAIAEKLEAMNE